MMTSARAAAANHPALLPFALLMLYGVLAGATFSVSKIAFLAGVSPLAYTLWQALGAGAVMLAICLLRRVKLPLDGPHLACYAVCGLSGIALPNLDMFYVLSKLPAGIVAVVVATVPLFTYTLSFTLSIEHLELRRVIGIAFGVAGSLLILVPRTSLPSPELTMWAAMAFLAPLFWGISHVYVARHRPLDSTAITLTAGMLIVAALGLAPATLFSDHFYVFHFPMGTAEYAILLQIVISSLCYLSFFGVIRLAGPVYFSQVGYIATMTGLFWGILIFDESYSAWVWSAVVLIFVGLAFVNRNPFAAR